MGDMNLDPAAQAAIKKVDDASATLNAEITAQHPPAATPQEAPKDTTPASEQTKPADLQIKDTPQGSPFDPFFKEFNEAGKLSDESIIKLEGMGLPKQVIEAYIGGLQAQATSVVSETHKLVGGSESYTKMTTWASTNLSAEQKEVFNTALQGSPAQRQMAVMALKAQYEAAFGSEPRLVGGNAPTGPASSAFASRAEVTEAMRDPRYRGDPAYRQMVANRIAAMDVF